MTQITCSACWNPINWCESFNKFGHADGEDCIHTPTVAKALRDAGYYVRLHDVGSPNPVIIELGEEGEPGELAQFYADDMPAGNQPGYTNPRATLPPEVVALLDRLFGTGEFFG